MVICEDGTVFVFEDEVFTTTFSIDASKLVTVSITASGDLLCVFEQSIVIYSIADGTEQKVEIFDATITDTKIMDETQKVVVGFDNGTWVIWDMTGVVTGPFTHADSGPVCICVVSSSQIATYGVGIKLWNTTGSVKILHETDVNPDSLTSVGCNGQFVFSTDGETRFWSFMYGEITEMGLSGDCVAITRVGNKIAFVVKDPIAPGSSAYNPNMYTGQNVYSVVHVHGDLTATTGDDTIVFRNDQLIVAIARFETASNVSHAVASHMRFVSWSDHTMQILDVSNLTR